MKLICSNFPPAKVVADNFLDIFEMNMNACDHMRLSSGYISVDSCLFLAENVRMFPKTDLVVGMHGFEGFTYGQYSALKKLTTVLQTNELGNTYICKAFPFHGKVYSFSKNGSPFAAIVGSSNLSNLSKSHGRTYEVDVSLNDPGILSDIEILSKRLQERACVTFDQFIPTFIVDKRSNPINNVPDVQSISDSEVFSFKQKIEGPSFALPLKCEAKSNLNVFFGEGRRNTATSLVIPRPWYEVEVIVPKSVTSQEGYPKGIDFTVVTDDGYMFQCATNGDCSKNFRSKGGLEVLGSWIKGRMEARNIIQIGERIEDRHLTEYGRHDITLSKTSKSDTYFLDFSVDK